MTELTKYDAPQAIQRDVVDGWAGMLTQTAALAREIAQTDFVPKALRGNAAAVSACILAGRELGLGPMASLQNLFVIDGTPALRAQMMRALVLAHGHSYRIAEWTAQRCVMWGTRAGSSQEQGPAEFTMENARQAGLLRKPVWAAYPKAMLLARTTAELCRAVFPDALAGMSYAAEELADMAPGDLGQLQQPMPEQPQAITSTVQREQRPEQPQAGGSSLTRQPAAQDSAEVELEGDAPQADGIARASQEQLDAARARADAEAARQAPAPAPAPAPAQAPDGPATREQGQMLHALFGELYPDGLERGERIRIAQGLLSRRVESFNQLSMREASQVIDTLVLVRDSREPQAWLEHLADEGLRALDLVEGTTEELPADADVVEGPWEGQDS